MVGQLCSRSRLFGEHRGCRYLHVSDKRIIVTGRQVELLYLWMK